MAKGKRTRTGNSKLAEIFSSRGGKAALIAVIAIAVIAAAGLIGGALLGHSERIHPGLALDDIELGGMTRNQAAAALAAADWEKRDFGSVNVELPGGNGFTVSAEDAGLTMDCKEAAEAAYAFGHSGNPIKDLLSYFRCIAGKATVADLVNSGDTKALKKIIKSETKNLNKLIGDGYIVDTDKATLTLVKGLGSAKLDIDKLCGLITDALEKGDKSVKYEFTYTEDAKCDFGKIREAIYSKPVNASYDVKTEKVTESSKGVDLNVDDAEKLWKTAKTGELVVVPLEVSLPEYSLEDFDGKLFSNLLGSQTSNYSSSSSNRATNVGLAASKIDGVILNPGDEFSYNDVVGKRTEAAGFKPAGAYANGKTVNEVGGGICQVSSTLYCAALYANLEITSRSCHYFPVGYLPAGLDATVSWGGPEFKFVNNRTFPIKIVAKCVDRNLKIEIWGTDVDGTHVEMNYTTSGASGGYNADTYRSVFAKDGTLISRTHEAHSFYHYHTEETQQTQSPSESAAPQQTPSTDPTPTPPVESSAPSPDPTSPIDVIEGIIDNTPFE